MNSDQQNKQGQNAVYSDEDENDAYRTSVMSNKSNKEQGTTHNQEQNMGGMEKDKQVEQDNTGVLVGDLNYGEVNQGKQQALEGVIVGNGDAGLLKPEVNENGEDFESVTSQSVSQNLTIPDVNQFGDNKQGESLQGVNNQQSGLIQVNTQQIQKKQSQIKNWEYRQPQNKVEQVQNLGNEHEHELVGNDYNNNQKIMQLQEQKPHIQSQQIQPDVQPLPLPVPQPQNQKQPSQHIQPQHQQQNHQNQYQHQQQHQHQHQQQQQQQQQHKQQYQHQHQQNQQHHQQEQHKVQQPVHYTQQQHDNQRDIQVEVHKVSEPAQVPVQHWKSEVSEGNDIDLSQQQLQNLTTSSTNPVSDIPAADNKQQQQHKQQQQPQQQQQQQPLQKTISSQPTPPGSSMQNIGTIPSHVPPSSGLSSSRENQNEQHPLVHNKQQENLPASRETKPFQQEIQNDESISMQSRRILATSTKEKPKKEQPEGEKDKACNCVIM